MVYLIRITEFDNNKQISRMKKFLNTAAAFITALLLITGCSPETPPERISRIGKTAMGDVIFPRNGEGELLEAIEEMQREGMSFTLDSCMKQNVSQ